jgi:EAL domain-containing protein (putative c-di-GMP-specific phosphodiesterase class I)
MIAEGIESPEQLIAIKLAGCKQCPGFLPASPMPPEAFLDALGATCN